MAEHNELGKRGEQIAADFLKKKGFSVKHTNWRYIHHEIDIIAEEAGMLVIVEVKTRQSLAAGPPETFVTPDKQKKLIRAANAYVKYRNVQKEVRFDIVSVLIMGEETSIVHIPDAFYPMMR